MQDFVATVRTLAFALCRWEPWRVLSRGERARGPDLGPRRIPLAASGEWTGRWVRKEVGRSHQTLGLCILKVEL